jgi:hypothetical protein
MGNIDTVVQENIRLKSMMADIAARTIGNNQQVSQENLKLTQDVQNLLAMMGQKERQK